MITTTDSRLEALLTLEVLEVVDVELGLALADLVGEHDADLRLAIALASRAPRHGHTCLELAHTTPAHLGIEDAVRTAMFTWPDPAGLRTAVARSQLLRASEVDRGTSPLVLRSDRLYLQRFDALEESLAEALRQRLASGLRLLTRDDEHRLAQLFPRGTSATGAPLDDAQRNAAALALRSPLAIITGGPGTGKTTTVLRMLAALLAHADAEALPEVLLLAPTGKAAARLTESIQQGRATLPDGLLDDARIAALPERAETVHRALGVHPQHVHRPRHHARNPLSADLVIVDETSMVDLPLMTRLLAAIRPEARLVLLGDADQLASVDAGAVLRDLVESDALAPVVTTLVHSRRFDDSSALGRLVTAWRGPSWATVQRALQDALPVDSADDVLGLSGVAVVEASRDALPRLVRQAVRSHVQRVGTQPDAQAALDTLLQFRLLTALRRGPMGAEAINAEFARERGDALAPGTPVLIVENAPDLGLANGDLGVAWRDEANRAVVVFPDLGGVRIVAPRRLPRWEPAYAMTVHKAQGSEFDRVMLLLPSPPSPLLTRELVYTGISRAQRGVTIVTPAGALHASHNATAQRATGLRDRLLVRSPEKLSAPLSAAT